ncbi:MAG TPA: 4-(cytidine 5'-diphospho)-2-C-methyl-D-erythritol kinase, partial [bacterium]|nr:4-(cytidine 5'-diphospho)-2-C-methyl-D-erythritol kinase [bacterium]
ESEFPVEKGAKNLVFRAASLLKETAGKKEDGARIVLKKKIPVGSGLGGGSGNVWAALTGLNKLWKLGLSQKKLEGLAARISSDAPFFFHQPLAWVRGRGETVKSVDWGYPYRYILIVVPDFSLSTREVYSSLKTKLTTMPGINKMKSSIIREGWYKMCFNRLEDAAFRMRPELAGLKEKIIKSGAAAALLSGSGSSLWAAFDKRSLMEKASARFLHTYRLDLLRQKVF